MVNETNVLEKDIKIAAIFSDHMILQRGKTITVFGEGQENCEIEVTLSNKDEKILGTGISRVIKGKWEVNLPKQEAAEGCKLSVLSNADGMKQGSYFCKEFRNIAIGEVWLAGGQSNMEFKLLQSEDGKECMDYSNGTDEVRYYEVPKIGYMNQEFFAMEEDSAWKCMDGENEKSWSAVGFHFAKKIARELGVKVGIIGCNWGGTSASVWTKTECMESERTLNVYLEEYLTAIEGKSVTEQEQEYDAYMEYAKVWNKKCDEIYKERPSIEWNEVLETIGDSRWPGPKSCKNPYRPGGLYQTMIQRICPYTIKGVLWYQGESDDHRPHTYETLLTKLIRTWREDWRDLQLPFLLVQLPMYKVASEPDHKHWCIIREAQMNVFQTHKNVGIAVALDCGMLNDVHPKVKGPVGERLALQALGGIYKILPEEEVFGPLYDHFEQGKDCLDLFFQYAKEGIDISDSHLFEVAGRDGIYEEAMVENMGDRIRIRRKDGSLPLRARYAWTNYGEGLAFGKNKIPMAPFRTHREDELYSSNNA